MASKAAAIREAYRDAKSLYKRGRSSLSRARNAATRTRKVIKKAMPKRKAPSWIHEIERDIGVRKPYRKATRPAGTKPAGWKQSRGSSMGKMSRFSTKKRKPRKLGKANMVKRHFDDYGTIKRDHVLWAGFMDHGSQVRMFEIMGEAVAKAMLARIKVYPLVYDKPLNTGVNTGTELKMAFKRVNGSGQALTFTETITGIRDMTFKEFAYQVYQKIQHAANGSYTKAPSDTSDRVAYYLYSSYFFDDVPNNHEQRFGHIENFDLAMVDINVFCKTKLQNITKNIDNSNDLDRVGVNPISGKKYSMRSQTARLVSQVQATDDNKYDGFCQTHGGNNGVVAIQQLGVDDALAHPPAARAVFTNCSSVQNISIPAGGTKFDSTTFRMRCTMRKMVERLYDYGIDRSSFGKCTWFCFERTHRQAETGTIELNDIKLAFNREVIMSATCTLKKPMPMLKHYDNSDLGTTL